MHALITAFAFKLNIVLGMILKKIADDFIMHGAMITPALLNIADLTGPKSIAISINFGAVKVLVIPCFLH